MIWFVKLLTSLLKFFRYFKSLNYDNLWDDDDNDVSNNNDKNSNHASKIIINREYVYNVNNIVH